MRDLIKSNFHMARMFTNTVRYIDDLLTLNNPSFEVEITSIYPPELGECKYGILHRHYLREEICYNNL